MKELENKTYWSLEELLRYTGYSKNYIYKRTAAGEFPHYKFGVGKLFFKRDEVFKLIEDNRVRTNRELEAGL